MIFRALENIFLSFFNISQPFIPFYFYFNFRKLFNTRNNVIHWVKPKFNLEYTFFLLEHQNFWLRLMYFSNNFHSHRSSYWLLMNPNTKKNALSRENCDKAEKSFFCRNISVTLNAFYYTKNNKIFQSLHVLNLLRFPPSGSRIIKKSNFHRYLIWQLRIKDVLYFRTNLSLNIFIFLLTSVLIKKSVLFIYINQEIMFRISNIG